MDRREFLKTLAGGTCACAISSPCGVIAREKKAVTGQSRATGQSANPIHKNKALHEALYYNKLENKEIQCILCPRKCLVGDQERGYCGARENQEGIYYSLVYNHPCSIRPDPIENKPFYHFLPRSRAYSLAMAGCNMNCKYCQNWEISQARPEQIRSLTLSPEACVQQAAHYHCASMAYTYTEPVIFWEYMADIAANARAAGIKNTMISAGFIEEKPLRDLLPLLDAVKIDLKAFSEGFYKDVCRGRLEPVLHSLKIIRELNVWMEIVYLVLPTLNDDEKEIQALCQWIYQELGPEVPIHFSRFYPTYLMKNLPPTPVSTLTKLHKIARSQGLRYVYIGNVPGHRAESTYCPDCHHRLIHRKGYNVTIEALEKEKCRHCGTVVPGVWKKNT